MASAAQVRAHLLAIRSLTEATGITLFCLTDRLGDNLDLVEYAEGLTLLQEALVELQTTACGATDFCHQMWHRMGAEGLDK